MSASLAAARKRRGAAADTPTPTQPNQPGQQPVGLTLPQVIALVDTRLTTLEKFMKEQKEAGNNMVSGASSPNVGESSDASFIPVIRGEIENIVEEFNSRYELLATEITNIKDIVLKLQSFTMEVNKTLVNERVRILSDVNSNITISDEVIGEHA